MDLKLRAANNFSVQMVPLHLESWTSQEHHPVKGVGYLSLNDSVSQLINFHFSIIHTCSENGHVHGYLSPCAALNGLVLSNHLTKQGKYCCLHCMRKQPDSITSATCHYQDYYYPIRHTNNKYFQHLLLARQTWIQTTVLKIMVKVLDWHTLTFSTTSADHFSNNLYQYIIYQSITPRFQETQRP